MNITRLSSWIRLPFRLGVAMLFLAALQLALLAILIVAGLAPSKLSEVSGPVLLVILAVSWLAAFLTLRGLHSLQHRSSLGEKGFSECWVRPLEVTGESVILEFDREFGALGFVSLAPEWLSHPTRLLEALQSLGLPVVLVAACPIGGTCEFFLVVRCSASNPEEAQEGVAAACYGVEQALARRGVKAKWVQGEQEIERHYWLSILGKKPHQEVAIRCKEGLVETYVGLELPRLLVAVDLLGSVLNYGEGKEAPILPSGLLSLLEGGSPLFLAISLRPVAGDWVAQRLRKLAAASPEIGLMTASLGEAASLQMLRRTSAPLAAELAVLLAGRSEGLWECECHLICLLTDTPSLLETLTLRLLPLDCIGFESVVTAEASEALEPSPPSDRGWLLPTSTLFRLLFSDRFSIGRNEQNTEVLDAHGGAGRG